MNTAAQVKTLLQQLLASERLASRERAQRQYKNLTKLAQHAHAHSPWFAARLANAGLTVADLATPEGLHRLPLLTRRDLQTHGTAMHSAQIPPHHGGTGIARTSGSSGEPVVVTRTALNQSYWLANGLREHLWHRRDFSLRLAAIRANLPGNQPSQRNDWGEPVSLLFASGPAFGYPIDRPVHEQAAWLQHTAPHYLLVYPNNLAALLDILPTLPSLKQLRTIGETLSPALRTRAEAQWGAPIADTYSSQELGTIAMQCPESGLYHITDEHLIVEVLNDDGKTCTEGEIGRVVVTDLANYAMPLLRYAIGDYAEVAGPCPCGRTLPTLRAIKGRERNMAIINGQKRWPLVGFHQYRDIAPVQQYQLVQKTADHLEAHFAVEQPLTPEQEAALARTINTSLGHAFTIAFTYHHGQIPVPASGKFEEFICEIRE